MLATLIKEPFDHPDWIFEVKWDGYRAIAEIRDGDVSLYFPKPDLARPKVSSHPGGAAEVRVRGRSGR